jgi:excisionase family DNA binding protein
MGGALRMEKLLSVAAAAALLGVHRTRINQLIDSGDLPATRIGRSYAIREADLEKVKDRPAPGRPTKEAGAKKAAKKSKKGAK